MDDDFDNVTTSMHEGERFLNEAWTTLKLSFTGNYSHSGQMLAHVSLGLLLSLLITISILGNILVCIAILTDKSLRKVSENIMKKSFSVLDREQIQSIFKCIL